MKYFFRSIVIVGMMLFYTTSYAAIELTLSADPNPVTVGGLIDIEIAISGLGDGTATSLGGYQFDLTFDSALLSLDSVQFGDPTLGNQLDLFNLGINFPDVIASPGSLALAEVSLDLEDDLNLSQAGAFTLLTVSFEGIGTGTSALNLSNIFLSDASGMSVPVDEVTGVDIQVNAASQVPEPPTILLLGISLLLFGGFTTRKA